MYNSIEYSDNYSKRLGSLRQYYRDEPATRILQYTTIWINQIQNENNRKTPTNGNTKDVKIKHVSNFCRTLEILSISCEIILSLTWSKDCVISSAKTSSNRR